MMSNWKECGHEVCSTETECLFCRITELEQEVKDAFYDGRDARERAESRYETILELNKRITELEATIARIDSVVARMINEEVWADDGHRIAGIIRGDKQATEKDDDES